MKALIAAAVSFVALTLVAVVVGIFNYISYSNMGVTMETNLEGRYLQTQNVYTQYTQKVREVSQVPLMMTDDTQRIIKEALQGRYGPEGSRAVFQAITEQNPNLDPALYQKIQQVIDAGREEFKSTQALQIDMLTTYRAQLGYFWSGFWLRLTGYPKADLSKYEPILTAESERVFQEGKEQGPLQLRPAQ